MRKTMHSLLLGWLFLFSLSAAAQSAQSTQPQLWHGELATPSGKLMLLVRIDAAQTSGDLESIHQAPGQKMALGAVQASAAKLSFTIPVIGASYEAAWNEGEQAWVGQFRQGMLLPLTLKRGAPPAAATVDGLDGDWRAVLRRDGRDLRLVLHVVTDTLGTRVTLDSPDLGAFGLPVEGLVRIGNSVRFGVPSTGVQFTGQLGAGLGSMTGAWSRDGQTT